MCGGEREPCKTFVLTNLEKLKRTLLDSLKTASSPAKRVRTLNKLSIVIFTYITCTAVIFGRSCFLAQTEVSDPHSEADKR